MKRNKIALASAAFISIGAIALAGCSSSSPEGGDAPAGESTTGIVSINSSEPQNPIVPSNTNEADGSKVTQNIFAGLLTYEADGTAVNDGAEDITVDAPNQLTVKLREGTTFTDGEEVTADNFTKAWNYGALLSNAQNLSAFYEDIEGYSNTADSELTGLEVVDDYTFTITLNKPAAGEFVQRLGYNAYYPLPDVAFEDMEAFGQNPIGNGPYKFDGDDAWQHDVDLKLVKNEDYDGPRVAKNGGLELRFYANMDGAYADLQGGELDVLDQIPDAALDSYKDDLGERWTNAPAAVLQTLNIPEWLPGFATDDEGRLRRAAISHAIDREQITQVVFKGTRVPATDFSAPVVDGWSDEVEGNDVLAYDPEKAKDLWAQADAIKPYSGDEFTISYNSDGPHQGWVDATAQSISNVLGIKAVGTPYPDFAGFLDARDNQQVGAFRAGWKADYPGLYNFLQPIYITGAGSNDGKYSSEKVDSMLAESVSQADSADVTKGLQAVETELFTDLPAIPLWNQNVTGGWSENVENVTFAWDSFPVFTEITKAE